jgi:flavin-dependent dehydrogenase
VPRKAQTAARISSTGCLAARPVPCAICCLQEAPVAARIVPAGSAAIAGNRRRLREGAAVGPVASWSEAGWMAPDAGTRACINLRRERLDPLLRRTAAATPGGDLLLGQTAVALIDTGGQVIGVRIRGVDGDERELRGRLVVGADGHRSTVARLAGASEDWAPNERFGVWAYYRGVIPRGPAENRIWQLGLDVGIVLSTDDALTMLAAFPSKARLEEFHADRAAALERFVAALPDGPDLSGAERVSKVIGMTDYPCVKRDPLPRPGLALVGDAAITGDPKHAVGCGWAFRAAEWLVDATVPAVRGGGDLSRALTRYRKALRVTPVSGLLNARVIVRALLIDRRVRRAAARAAAREVEQAVVRSRSAGSRPATPRPVPTRAAAAGRPGRRSSARSRMGRRSRRSRGPSRPRNRPGPRG